MGLHVVITLLFVLSPAAHAVEFPNCAHLIADRPLDAVLYELNGNNFFEPTPESLLGQYLARTGADSRAVQIRAQGQVGDPILAVAVSAESFPVFEEIFGDFPNMLEQVHPPNLYEEMVLDLPDVWHYWFRFMATVYDYVLPEGFRESGPWRFSAGNIGPMMLLSDTETRRLRNYFELTKEAHTPLRYPQQIPGFNFPDDAYTHRGNCTGCFFQAPIGDYTVNEVTVAGNLDTPAGSPERQPRTARLKSYTVPTEFAGRAALLQQVWNPNLNARLMDILEMPAAEALHAGGSWVAYALTLRAPRERVPFLAVYTPDHRRLPNGVQDHWRFARYPGNARDLAVGDNDRVWIIGTEQTPGGFTIHHSEGTGWKQVPGGAVRISAAGATLPWVVNENQDIFQLTESGWVHRPGKASDIGVGADGNVWCIGVENIGGGGYGIFWWNGADWEQVSGAAVRVAVDGSGRAWVVSRDGGVFAWNEAGNDWVHVPSPPTVDIAAELDGTPWILGSSIRSGGYEIYYFNGDSWIEVPGGGTSIAVGSDGAPWHSNVSDHIWKGFSAALEPARKP